MARKKKKSGVQDLADTMIKQHGLETAWVAALQQTHEIPISSPRYFIWSGVVNIIQQKRRGFGI